MYMKICVVGDVFDVVTYAKFQNEIFRGYSFTGVKFSIFPIDFEWALQQCSATALPVIQGGQNGTIFVRLNITKYLSIFNIISLSESGENL